MWQGDTRRTVMRPVRPAPPYDEQEGLVLGCHWSRRKDVVMEQVIYVADDERNIRELEAAFLTQEGFGVRTFATGDALLAACGERQPDLVVLDLMMPGSDGLDVCARLRQGDADLPIIIVSAKDSPYDRGAGLNRGGDDYLVKPFLPLELVAHVRALLRRSHRMNTGRADGTGEELLRYGQLQLHTGFHTASLVGRELSLTPTEFDFLAYLMRNQDRAVGRDELLRNLWQVDCRTDTRAADDLVKRLRRKLRENGGAVRVRTVWGFGFRLEADESEEAGGTVAVTVRDDGDGIDDADMPHLFERCYKGRGGHFGLGLSIAKAAADTMSGRLEASNAVRDDGTCGGAVFTLTLRRA